MARVYGTLPRKPDLDELTTSASARGADAALCLSPRQPRLTPDKYKMLEHRRRQAQIKARHLLEESRNGPARETELL
jgi:hypothetical protein